MMQVFELGRAQNWIVILLARFSGEKEGPVLLRYCEAAWEDEGLGGR